MLKKNCFSLTQGLLHLGAAAELSFPSHGTGLFYPLVLIRFVYNVPLIKVLPSLAPFNNFLISHFLWTWPLALISNIIPSVLQISSLTPQIKISLQVFHFLGLYSLSHLLSKTHKYLSCHSFFFFTFYILH